MKKSWKITIVLLSGILVISIILASTMGSAHIGTIESIKILISRIPLIGEYFITPARDLTKERIIIQIRLPRIIMGALAGAGLAVSGAVFQSLLRNPLADPYILGVSSGAALGVTIALNLGLNDNIWYINPLLLFAFMGSIMGISLVISISRTQRRMSEYTLILSGVIVSSFLYALMLLMMALMEKNIDKIVFWLMGNLQEVKPELIGGMLIYNLIGFLIIFAYSRDLNAMVLGDETAKQLGIDVERVKIILFIVASFITAGSVSVSGTIGFVGLMIPHLMRMIIGPDMRILLPSCFFAGSIFLIWADTLSRSILSAQEIPVGVLTAFTGAPFFLYILRRSKKSINI